MRRSIGSATLAVALLFVASPTLAQQPGRFTIEKSGNGYVRMDTTTGAISFCRPQDDQIVCKLSADDREAFQQHIADLESRIESLEERLRSLETGTVEAPGSELPTEQELERTLGFMEQFLRRFMDIVKEFEDEPADKRIAPPAQPEKT